jgi:copper chaperone CopZ
MDTLKFKTNIKCASCVAKVTPSLNELVGEGKWNVNLNDPARTLTINDELEAKKVIDALQKVGYKAEAA